MTLALGLSLAPISNISFKFFLILFLFYIYAAVHRILPITELNR